MNSSNGRYSRSRSTVTLNTIDNASVNDSISYERGGDTPDVGRRGCNSSAGFEGCDCSIALLPFLKPPTNLESKLNLTNNNKSSTSSFQDVSTQQVVTVVVRKPLDLRQHRRLGQSCTSASWR